MVSVLLLVGGVGLVVSSVWNMPVYEKKEVSWAPRSSGRRRSKEDESVLTAIDQLDQLSDDQLTRMLRKFENEENVEKGEGDTSNFLSWCMAQSQFGDDSREKTKSAESAVGKSTKTRGETSSASFDRSSVLGRNGRQRQQTTPCPSSTKPIAVPGQPGRFIFSFMQDDTMVAVDPVPFISVAEVALAPRSSRRRSSKEDESVLTAIDQTDEQSTNEDTFDTAMSEESPDQNTGIKLTRSERARFERRKRRDDVEEEWEAGERSEEENEFSDDQPEFRIDIPRKPKPKKKRELVGMLWDPSKPRPLPRRLRRTNLPPIRTGPGRPRKVGKPKRKCDLDAISCSN